MATPTMHRNIKSVETREAYVPSDEPSLPVNEVKIAVRVRDPIAFLIAVSRYCAAEYKR